MYKVFTRLLLLGLIGVYTNLSAQEYNLPILSGQVIDAQSGDPLIGAVISVDFKSQERQQMPKVSLKFHFL